MTEKKKGLPSQFTSKLHLVLVVFCCSAGSGSIHDDTSSMSYDKPYCRVAPYLVGMTLGFLLLYTREWKMSKVTFNIMLKRQCHEDFVRVCNSLKNSHFHK